MHYERTIHIDAPADAVWAVINDVERWPEWSESMTSVERLGDRPFGVGSEAKVKQPRLPAAVWRVTEHVPGRSFRWESTGPGVRSMGDHGVVPDDDGHSTATLVFDQGGPVGAVVGVVFGRMIRRYVDLEAEGLKRHSEAGHRG